jgi:hypothetical protein
VEKIARYTRAAQILADLRYVPFPDVCIVMPGLAWVVAAVGPSGRSPPPFFDRVFFGNPTKFRDFRLGRGEWIRTTDP